MAQISLIFALLAAKLLSVEVQKPLSGLNLEGFQKTIIEKDLWERNPFAGEQDEIGFKKPKLTMIVVGKKDSAALINSQSLRVKDRLGSSKVVSIKIGEVILRNQNGLMRLRIESSKSKLTEDTYHVQLKEASLGDAVKLLAMMLGKNVVMPSKLDELVTASFPQVTLMGALQAILESRAMTLHDKNHVIRIVSIKDEETLGGDLITRVFPLKYAKAKDTRDQAAQLVSSRGTVMVDERTNSLTMRDTANYIKNMETFIENIDFADKQVLIEARVVEASTDFVQNLGIQWGVKVNTSNFNMGGVSELKPGVSNTAPSGNSYINTTRSPNPLAALAVGIPFANSQLDFELSAAEHDQQATVLSRPSIVTMNNQPATIHSGRKIFIPVAGQVGLNPTGQLGAINNLQQISAGITMVVVPQITVDGKIKLSIDVTSSQFNDSSIENQRVQISDNNAKTQILLNDGETTVLGGLYQSSNSDSKGGIPILSRIPFFGALFRNSSDAKKKRELLVFIKPKIIAEAIKELDRSEKEAKNPLAF